MDFIKDIVQNSKVLIDAFVAAIKSKDFKAIVSSAVKMIRSFVFYVEKIAEAAEVVSEVLNGSQKHEIVMETLEKEIIPMLNEKIDIPFLSEEQELKYVFRPLFNVGIKAAVSFFNKKGWEVNNISA